VIADPVSAWNRATTTIHNAAADWISHEHDLLTAHGGFEGGLEAGKLFGGVEVNGLSLIYGGKAIVGLADRVESAGGLGSWMRSAAAGAINSAQNAAEVISATRDYVVANGWGSISDWIRYDSHSKIPPSLCGGSWSDRYPAIKGGGRNPYTNYELPFHYHIHQFNWYRPSIWFQSRAEKINGIL